MNRRRESMRECPRCEVMTAEVHTCSKCSVEGCEACEMPDGADSLCTGCQEEATDDSGANALLGDKDDD